MEQLDRPGARNAYSVAGAYSLECDEEREGGGVDKDHMVQASRSIAIE